jgi:hypothetical protein
VSAVIATFQPFDQEGFRALVQSLVEARVLVQWSGDGQPFVGARNGRPGSILSLDVQRIRDLGFENVVRVYDPITDAVAITYQKHVVYEILFSLSSFEFNIPGFSSLTALLLKFRRDTVSDQLTPLAMAYALHHPINTFEDRADNRPIYRSETTVEFNGLVTETDDTDTGGYINQINGGPAAGFNAPGVPIINPAILPE